MTEQKPIYHTKRNHRRTAHFPSARITPDDLNKLAHIVKVEHQSIADWVTDHIQQDYLRLFSSDKIVK